MKNKWFIGILADILILIGVFFSVRSNGLQSGVLESVRPQWVLITFFALFLFFHAIYWLLFTDTNAQKRIAILLPDPKKKGLAVLIGTGVYIFTFFQFIVLAVVVAVPSFNPEVEVQQSDWVGMLFAILLMISIVVLVTMQVVLRGDERSPEKQQAVDTRWRAFIHKHAEVSASLYSLGSLLTPVLQFWFARHYVAAQQARDNEPNPLTNAHVTLAGIALTVVLISAFDVVISTHAQSLDTIFYQAGLLFVFLYLPLKAIFVMVTQQKQVWIRELLTASGFFLMQLGLVYLFL